MMDTNYYRLTPKILEAILQDCLSYEWYDCTQLEKQRKIDEIIREIKFLNHEKV